MFCADKYINELRLHLQNRFENRLRYLGLQGSYLRGEATEQSDIDIMVVIDGFTIQDMDIYREIINRLDSPERSCGFICGKEELDSWNPMEICHLLHCTKDYYGDLTKLVPSYTEEDVRNYVKLSLNNLYHELCHRYIHSSREQNIVQLPDTYRSVFFVPQNLHYLRTCVFPRTKAEMLPLLSGQDKQILERHFNLCAEGAYDFDEAFALIFSWCKDTLAAL